VLCHKLGLLRQGTLLTSLMQLLTSLVLSLLSRCSRSLPLRVYGILPMFFCSSCTFSFTTCAHSSVRSNTLSPLFPFMIMSVISYAILGVFVGASRVCYYLRSGDWVSNLLVIFLTGLSRSLASSLSTSLTTIIIPGSTLVPLVGTPTMTCAPVRLSVLLCASLQPQTPPYSVVSAKLPTVVACTGAQSTAGQATSSLSSTLSSTSSTSLSEKLKLYRKTSCVPFFVALLPCTIMAHHVQESAQEPEERFALALVSTAKPLPFPMCT
jgi:hypothetical protein